MDAHFYIAITLAVLAGLWVWFKFFFWIWAIGRGMQFIGNQILLQEAELEERNIRTGTTSQTSAFSGEVPQGYGTPINQWKSSPTVQSNKGGTKLTVIKGGKQ